MTVTPNVSTIGAPRNPPRRDPELWAASRSLEASFLAQMLRSAGLGEARSEFGGGAGEAQFADLMVAEQARLMAQAGGLGLAESIYRALTAREV